MLCLVHDRQWNDNGAPLTSDILRRRSRRQLAFSSRHKACLTGTRWKARSSGRNHQKIDLVWIALPLGGLHLLLTRGAAALCNLSLIASPRPFGGIGVAAIEVAPEASKVRSAAKRFAAASIKSLVSLRLMRARAGCCGIGPNARTASSARQSGALRRKCARGA